MKIQSNNPVRKKSFIKSIAMLLFASVIAATAMAQENSVKPRTITVNGTAEKELVPDEIFVQVDLREYDKKNGTKVEIESIRNNFLNACKALGLSELDISVQGYSGWDGNYWLYKKNKKKNPDMKAAISYWVKLNKVAAIDDLVAKLDDEATQNFFVAKTSFSKEKELKKQLKLEAIQSAKEKAAYLAGAINEQIGKPLTINEPNEINHYPQPVYYGNAMMKTSMDHEAAPAPMDVDYKKIKYAFEVMVVFELK